MNNNTSYFRGGELVDHNEYYKEDIKNRSLVLESIIDEDIRKLINSGDYGVTLDQAMELQKIREIKK